MRSLQRITNPLGHPSTYHPSDNTTQLERETQFIISPTRRWLHRAPDVVFTGQIYDTASAPCWGSSPACLPYTPSPVLDWPQLCSQSQRDDRAAEEFLCSVPKPTGKRRSLSGRARSSDASLPALTWPRFVEIWPANTKPCPSWPLQTLPTYVQMHPENVSPRHSMFSVGHRHMAKPRSSSPYLPVGWILFAEARWNLPACLFSFFGFFFFFCSSVLV